MILCKDKKIKSTGIILAFMVAGVLVSCGQKSEEKKVPVETPNKVEELVIEDDSEKKEETVIVDKVEEPKNINLLTGLDDVTEEEKGNRPVAIMVNNIPAALPQYGIEQADVIFEIPVESDLTRLMAIYASYTSVPDVCSVRSCRSYFPALSEGFDAIYVSWGMDGTIKSYIDGLNLTYFNGKYGTGGLFSRDSDRKNAGYAMEHTGVFRGTKLAEAMDSLKWRTNLEDDKLGSAFKFNNWQEVVKPVGDECQSIDIDFGGQTAQFEYDETNNVYLKNHNNKKHIDGKSGKQLAFTNVFVLETDITVKDSKGRKNVDWKGGEDAVGYYISNGTMQPIRWSKSNEEAYLKFYTLDGEELSINRGKSYIALNYANQATY